MSKVVIQIVKRDNKGQYHTMTTNPMDKKSASMVMEFHGYKVTGLQSNHRLREEIRDMPVISSLCGPMWGGMVDGFPCVRYEDQATNDSMSI